MTVFNVQGEGRRWNKHINNIMLYNIDIFADADI